MRLTMNKVSWQITKRHDPKELPYESVDDSPTPDHVFGEAL